MPRAKKAYQKIPDRQDFDPDEWGNIELPGITDEQLRKTNWNLKPTQAQKLHHSRLMSGRKWTKTHRKKISKSNKKPKPFTTCKFCGVKSSTSNFKKYKHGISLDVCKENKKNQWIRVKGVRNDIIKKREELLGRADESLWFKVSVLQFAKLLDKVGEIKEKKISALALAKKFNCNKAVIYKIQRNIVDWDRVKKCRKLLIDQKKLKSIDKIIAQTLKKLNKGVYLG